MFFKFSSPKGKPPEDPPNQYGTRAFHRKPKKEMPTPKSQKGKPILSFEEWNKLTSGFEFPIPPTNSKEPTPPPCQYSKYNKYSIVTRDEFILNFIKEFNSSKEKAIESFENLSKGYNFVLAVGDNHFYSVDYINKSLER